MAVSIIAEPVREATVVPRRRGSKEVPVTRGVRGAMRPVGRGDRGKRVVDVQTRLAALGYFLGREGADGLFGPHTETAIRAFQQRRLLFADGLVEDNTWTELVEAGYEPGERLLYLRVPYMRGDDVLYLQRRLNELGFDTGPVDGIFGPPLEEAVTDFQRNAGLNVDGIVGETTLDRLRRLRQINQPEDAGGIPDRMNGYVGTRSLRGLRVSIEPAPLGLERGSPGNTGQTERELSLALAAGLGDLLESAGTSVFLLRGELDSLSLYERTEAAIAWGPDIHLCLRHGYSPSPRAQGAVALYFANSVYLSRGGRRLAGYIVDALSRELGRVDLHKHGRNYACLREVKPLAVLVEPGFISHPEEARLLADPEVIGREATAILHGIQAYLARL
jgi:N-acetylmuramoyl-L-alanine amidase